MKYLFGYLALMCLCSFSSTAMSEEDGYSLFSDRCALCHREAGPGTFMLERRLGTELSILENRDNLTQEYIKTIVRWGIGSMPRFTRGEVSDAELDLIMDYLINEKKD